MTSATIKNRHAKLFIIRGYFLTTGMSVRLGKTHREWFGVTTPSRHRNGQLSTCREIERGLEAENRKGQIPWDRMLGSSF